MNFLASMLSDGAGNTSTLRVVILLFVAYVLALHLALSVKTGAMVPFTGDELSLLGILLGTKLVQNQQEKNAGEPPALPKNL